MKQHFESMTVVAKAAARAVAKAMYEKSRFGFDDKIMDNAKAYVKKRLEPQDSDYEIVRLYSEYFTNLYESKFDEVFGTCLDNLVKEIMQEDD